MIESPAWRALDMQDRRALDRIWLEHMNHAGTANGELIVTHQNFRESGVRGDSVADAIERLEALGWIDIMLRGKASFDGAHFPSKYSLTWLPQVRPFKLATNRWKTHKNKEAVRGALKERGEASPGSARPAGGPWLVRTSDEVNVGPPPRPSSRWWRNRAGVGVDIDSSPRLGFTGSRFTGHFEIRSRSVKPRLGLT
jgi:hypothetical protein